MGYLLRALVATVALALPSWSQINAVAASTPGSALLSRSDQLVGSRAAMLAGHTPASALRWLKTQPAIRAAQLGRDGATLDLHFTDGRQAVILPASVTRTRISIPSAPHIRPLIASHDAPARRAIVLEPFATELDLGTSAGQDEAASLTRAGFAVSVFRNTQVTIPLLESLAQYSVVYFQTHAGLLPNGDAVVVTGQADPNPDKSPYSNLYQEHSLLQAFVAGDPKKILYDSITANFVNLHMGMFPNDSILFLNGCATLSAYTLVAAFHARNLSTVISWDGELFTATNDASGTYVMARLALGETVTEAIADALIEGIGTSIVAGKPTRLGYDGNGSVSLRAALLGAQPTPTPIPTSIATSVPIQTSVPTFSGGRFGLEREL